VEAAVHLLHAVVDEVPVEDRALDELDVVRAREVLQVAPAARAEIVEDEHFVAARDQRVDEVRPDEACASGYQVTHELCPSAGIS
jgi:hypothetical protein